jgi:putative SOS response-associated peptidase YedK
MCYDFKAQLITQLKRARHHRDKEAVRILTERLLKLGVKDLHHTTGFDHPAVLIYTKDQPHDPVVARWGFVPESTKDKDKQLQVWNKTLNARGEDMFETWSFKYSARAKRCLICIDGVFEHYHFKGKTYPYYIHRSDGEPMTLGGLWSEWADKETGQKLTTFSIVTARGNDLLARIHNNPKLEGPRMPLILPDDAIDAWLTENVESDAEKEKILSLVKPYPEAELKAHTVRRLRGKEAVGNDPISDQEVRYPEHDPTHDQRTLF